MGIRSSLALPSVCTLLTEPKLSEIIIHLTFTPSSLSRAIHALRKTLSHGKLSNTIIKQSISNTFKIVSRKHELHPWKFINIELNFEGAEYIPLIDETLKEILRQFACNLGLYEGCPVSVGTSRFIPDSGFYVHGLVNHDELLHFIPRPRIFNGYLTRQLQTTETSNTIPCSKADEKIAQFTSIAFAQESNPDSASEDGSGEEPDIRPDFSELSEELNQQSQKQTQQPLKPQSMGAIPNGQPTTDYQTMQYQQIWKMQMQANAKHFNYQIPIHMTASVKHEPIETTNSSDDSDEDWAEKVETEREDTKERSCSYSLQNNTSGTNFEWPWAQIELYEVLQRPVVKESPTLQVDSRSDSEEATSFISKIIPFKAYPEQLASTGLGSATSFGTPCNALSIADVRDSTSPISECRPHLRGGSLPNRDTLKQCLKRISERISRRNFQYDIDLGYGGSSVSAEPFPEYDPTVDMAYLSDLNGTYRIDTRRNLRGNDSYAESIVKLHPEDLTQCNRLDTSSAESKSKCHHDFTKKLNSDNNSTRSYIGLQIDAIQSKGETGNTTQSSSIDSPSKLFMASHKHDKLRAMVESPLKSIKGKSSCEKFKKKARNGEIEDSDGYEDSEGICDKFKRPLQTMEKEESEKERESSEDKHGKHERYPALVGAGEGPHFRNAYQYPQSEFDTHLGLAAKTRGLQSDSLIIGELLSEECTEEYHSRNHVKESEPTDIYNLGLEETIQKKEKRLNVERIYRLINHSILKAKLVMGTIQKKTNLARIAQSQLFHGLSSDPKPYGPTMVYLTSKTQLRGGSGNEKETSFFTRNRLRLGRFLRSHSESEGATARHAPPATGNGTPGSESGLQRHHRYDSGISGMSDEQSRNKDVSVENGTPRQAVSLSEPGSQTTETVREVDSDTSEEAGNAAHSEHVEHVEYVEHVENTENVEDTDSSKPLEPRGAPRKRPERQLEEDETQQLLRSGLLDILWRFLALKQEIWFKRNAIIHGAPSSKNNFEAHLTADEVDDIRQYVQNSREMIEVSNRPRDADVLPDLVTRANNHLLRARRVRQIFDNWYAREGQQQRQNVSSTDADEGSSNIERSSTVPTRGVGVLDNWPFAAAPDENFRRDRNSSETSTNIPRTSSDTQLIRRRSSLILAPLPNLFAAPYPGQASRGETHGESSRSGASGGNADSIAEKIDVLRARNNISPRTSQYESSISSCGTQQGGMPNCSEQNEDHVYQEPISKETIQRLQDLGATRVEAVNLLNATAGRYEENAGGSGERSASSCDGDRSSDPESFLALLVSESDVGGAIDLLTGEATGATMNDEVISEDDSGNGSSSNGMKKDEEGGECENSSSSEDSDVEVAGTDEGLEPLVSETEDNEKADECEKGDCDGTNVNAAESDEEYQPLIDKAENNNEDDVHDDQGGIDNDGYDDTDSIEHDRAGEAPIIEVEMVLSSRKGKERAEGYNL
ncbi:hypothetical protein H4I95_09858 [Botrytis cinerea]